MKKKIAKAVKDRMELNAVTFKMVSQGSGVSTAIVQKIRDCGNYEIGGLIKVLVYLQMAIHIDEDLVIHDNGDFFCENCSHMSNINN